MQNARARKAQGKLAFRTDAEIAATIEPAEAALRKTGKDKKVGRPGNKHTRAALNEVNIVRSAISHPTQDGVGPPHAGWGGKGPCHPTRDGVEPHPTQDGASSTSLGSMAEHARAESVVSDDCHSAPMPASYVLTAAEPIATALAASALAEPNARPASPTPASDARTANGVLIIAEPCDSPAAPTLAKIPFPLIDGVYMIAGRREPVVAVDRGLRPIGKMRFANFA